jgi:hypothetical protein
MVNNSLSTHDTVLDKYLIYYYVSKVQLQADKNQEELGKRMIAYIDISLHRLVSRHFLCGTSNQLQLCYQYTNHYISYVLRRDENVRITITESLQKM